MDPYIESGRWRTRSDTLVLESSTHTDKLLMDDDVLRMLDAEGHLMTIADTSMFVFRKVKK